MPELSNKHIISVLLENEAGALMRVAGLFSARGYNIESLIVAATENPSLSRMTIVTEDDGDLLTERIIAHLNKLIDVVEVIDLSRQEHIEREMLLLKLSCPQLQRDSLMQWMADYQATLIEAMDDVAVIEVMAPSYRIDKLIADCSKQWKVLELARSGVISLGREHLSFQAHATEVAKVK